MLLDIKWFALGQGRHVARRNVRFVCGVLCHLAASLSISCGYIVSAADHSMPTVEGDWWQIAGDPDLGELTHPNQQPVDFAIWRAKDGTWQLWSCIRHTKCGGKTRLFYRWEGQDLHDTHWKPMGIAMQADPSLGETEGGMQAPHVIQRDGVYYMFYGDINRICLAKSDDGKTFTRVLNERSQPDLFSGPYDHGRDPMVMKHCDLYYCYYMGHAEDKDPQSAIFCRTSPDLRRWSEAVMVSGGGSPAKKTDWYGGDSECPFVVQREGLFYLFRNQVYGQGALNTQYASANPLDFGVNDDRFLIAEMKIAAPEIIDFQGQSYIAALMPTLKGIQIAKLHWQTAHE
jgi:hypothetical protein